MQCILYESIDATSQTSTEAWGDSTSKSNFPDDDADADDVSEQLLQPHLNGCLLQPSISDRINPGKIVAAVSRKVY